MGKILKIHPNITVCLFILVTLILPLSQVRAEETSDNTQVKQHNSALEQVDSKYVCMLNNQYYDKGQIPIIIDENTYYGCCEMCKAKLKMDPNSRVAVDPISGIKVDKAQSVIGVSTDGSVYYFESEENLRKYITKAEQKD